MKNSLKCVVLLSTAFLISCGSQQNFRSRKYTKGKFRVANKRIKSSSPELKKEQELATIDLEEQQMEREHLIQMNLQEESTRSIAEIVPLDEVHSTVQIVDREETQMNYSSPVSSVSTKSQHKPRSEIAETIAQKKKKDKNQLSPSQRRARSSLTWGIVAVSLAVVLITLSLLSGPAFVISPVFYFLLIGRSMRIALIPAVIGIVQSTIAKFGNEDLGKYEKHQKVGFWLSISTLLLWALLA
jgi:hypothetical protein